MKIALKDIKGKLHNLSLADGSTVYIKPFGKVEIEESQQTDVIKSEAKVGLLALTKITVEPVSVVTETTEEASSKKTNYKAGKSALKSKSEV